MAFIKKYAFQIAVLILCLLMAAYLLSTYVFQRDEPYPILNDAPQFTLKSIEGNEVSMEDTKGKIKIVYFYFASCPDVCPPTTYILGEVQEKLREEGRLGSEVEFISISFDPDKDTDEVIRQFAERTGAELEGWHFLRGDTREQMIDLAQSYGVPVIYDDVAETFYHFNPVILVDQNNKIRAQVNGSPNVEAGDEPFTADVLYDALKLVR